MLSGHVLCLFEGEEEKHGGSKGASREESKGADGVQLFEHLTREDRDEQDDRPEGARGNRKSLVTGHLAKVDPSVRPQRDLERKEEDHHDHYEQGVELFVGKDGDDGHRDTHGEEASVDQSPEAEVGCQWGQQTSDELGQSIQYGAHSRRDTSTCG